MNKTNTQTFTTKTILQNYNPQFKDKILCIGGNTNRAEKMVTEVMVKLMIEHNLTFEEVDEIVFGISVDSYLTSKYYSKLFKYLVLDKSEFLFPKGEEIPFNAEGTDYTDEPIKLYQGDKYVGQLTFSMEILKAIIDEANKSENLKMVALQQENAELKNEVEELKRKIRKLKVIIDFFKEDKKKCTKSWW